MNNAFAPVLIPSGLPRDPCHRPPAQHGTVQEDDPPPATVSGSMQVQEQMSPGPVF
uniref:Uncharacterized protein n=1 Tax=Setaria italica TaxID=4555 RepID=K3ZYY9_SETIT